jgi:hypothetical protein
MSTVMSGALGDGRRGERISASDWFLATAATVCAVLFGIFFGLIIWGANHG